MQAYASPDGLRAGVLLVLALGQAVAAYWPELRGHRDTIASRSAALDNPVVPLGPFFAIWLLIFSSCFGFAAWHAMPAQLADPAWARIGWLAAALFAANIVWEVSVPRRGLGWLSVLVIVVELTVALVLFVLTLRLDATGLAWWLGPAPLQLFAGWVSVAAFANAASTLLGSGARMGPGDRAPVLLLAAAGSLAAGVAALSGSWPHAAAATWGLAGAALGARSKGAERAAAVAALGALLTLAAPLA